ncbi:MAG: hypothetical protein J6P42_01075 [Oscillospiraceae bacterium]|nr:hypothetical protein [Oscillospiraceae bacterium]
MLKIDCGNCGSNNVQLDHDIYRCMSCGKKYTAAEAEQRDQDLKKWDQMRKLQIILLVASFAFMVFASILLPGYASEGSHAALIITATCICLALFVAAIVARIRFGKMRKKLYRR